MRQKLAKQPQPQSINRIRLEFKGSVHWIITRISKARINRIRLEFKGYIRHRCSDRFHVLIESDWNLKEDEMKKLTIETVY